MQVSIEDDLRDSREVTFQAALLYTSSKGERRIRVHTLCVPTSASVPDIINSADQQAVIGMLTKFGKNDLLENRSFYTQSILSRIENEIPWAYCVKCNKVLKF